MTKRRYSQTAPRAFKLSFAALISHRPPRATVPQTQTEDPRARGSRRRSGAADTLPVLVLLPHQTKDIMHIMVLDV